MRTWKTEYPKAEKAIKKVLFASAGIPLLEQLFMLAREFRRLGGDAKSGDRMFTLAWVNAFKNLRGENIPDYVWDNAREQNLGR